VICRVGNTADEPIIDGGTWSADAGRSSAVANALWLRRPLHDLGKMASRTMAGNAPKKKEKKINKPPPTSISPFFFSPATSVSSILPFLPRVFPAPSSSHRPLPLRRYPKSAPFALLTGNVPGVALDRSMPPSFRSCRSFMRGPRSEISSGGVRRPRVDGELRRHQLFASSDFAIPRSFRMTRTGLARAARRRALWGGGFFFLFSGSAGREPCAVRSTHFSQHAISR